ncbi:MAG: hypothetical protein K8I30_00725 [Anaerolineae bacterium]|nr:hypothetical protein [Anaerolineae bacterium]
MPPGAAETAAEAAMGVSAAVWMVLILFWILSPIAGFFLFKLTRGRLPGTDATALGAVAFCGFLVVFAVTFLALLQFTTLDDLTAFFAGAAAALVVTLICTLAVWRLLAGSKARAQASVEEHAFRVWDEDRRGKSKNLRRKRQ